MPQGSYNSKTPQQRNLTEDTLGREFFEDSFSGELPQGISLGMLWGSPRVSLTYPVAFFLFDAIDKEKKLQHEDKNTIGTKCRNPACEAWIANKEVFGQPTGCWRS